MIRDILGPRGYNTHPHQQKGKIYVQKEIPTEEKDRQ